MVTEVAERMAEKLFLTGKSSGQNPRGYLVEATRITVVKANPHEGPAWN
tara:strand:- start:1364 stop:1510 length:147 start_codon:yes stop_codon:yes gene_type:complete